METSDSENFESADEDLQSDDEVVQSVEEGKKTEKNVDISDHQIEKLDCLELTDGNLQKLDDNKNATSERIIENKNTQIDDENNVSMAKSEEKPETRRQLGEKIVKTTTNANKDDDLNENLPKQSESVQNTVDLQLKNEPNKSADAIKNPTIEENLWDESELNWDESDKNSEENMWENDNWENIDELPPENRSNIDQQSQSELNPTTWSNWGNWGVTSLLSTATQGVSTITQSITTALETGIGVPDPEELAKLNRAERESVHRGVEAEQQQPDNSATDKNSGFGLEHLVLGVSHLTKLVETTGTKVITGGLDTLETIGKKTMEVLQEGDPGLKKKRAFLRIDQDKPVLSQILREAKEKAEQDNDNKEFEQRYEKKLKNYETLFDDHHGLVHLEALEMLSKQCEIKLQTLQETLTGDELVEIQETMDQIKELCELPEQDDEDENMDFVQFQAVVETAINEGNIPIDYKKLIETWQETDEWLDNLNLEICDEHELHQQAIETLAQLTAFAVERFHKTGELLLVKQHRSTADEAVNLEIITRTLIALIGMVANRFTDKLNAKSPNCYNKEELNSLITNVFLEAANSSSYIQDAYQLLIPVVQVGAV